MAEWFSPAHTDDAAAAGLKRSIYSHLDAARKEAEGRRDYSQSRLQRMIAAARGAGVERTLGNIDAVEIDLLRLAPLDYVRGQMPSLLAHVQRFLSVFATCSNAAIACALLVVVLWYLVIAPRRHRRSG